MRVLVACEESQAVTIEFRKLGHEAYSCDIEPYNNENEEGWRTIPEYPDYEASCLGRIRSKERVVNYSDGRIRKYNSKVLSPGKSVGYLFVNICMNGCVKSVKVHNLVSSAFLGVKPCGADVCHINGDKNDNRACNLEFGSRSKNNLDGYRIRDYVNKKQKLSPKIAKEILARLSLGESQRKLAKEYAVCKSTIAGIKNGTLYGWVKDP